MEKRKGSQKVEKGKTCKTNLLAGNQLGIAIRGLAQQAVDDQQPKKSPNEAAKTGESGYLRARREGRRHRADQDHALSSTTGRVERLQMRKAS